MDAAAAYRDRAAQLLQKPVAQNKRRRRAPDEVGREHNRRRVTADHHERSERLPREPVAHCVETYTWPKSAKRNSAVDMGPETFTKRRSSSTHPSERQQRLEQNGMYMKTSAILERASKQLCNDLLAGVRRLNKHPWYLLERTDEVLECLHVLNEARIQRDVTPWLVPSAEHLSFSSRSLASRLSAAMMPHSLSGMRVPSPRSSLPTLEIGNMGVRSPADKRHGTCIRGEVRELPCAYRVT